MHKTLACLLAPLCLTTACAPLAPAQPPAATLLSAADGLRLAGVFGEGMVLQRDRPIPVWGWGVAGQRVQVTLGAHSAQATVGPDGAWRVTLPAQPAGGPATLSVGLDGAAPHTLRTLRTLQGVMLGDVWLASGQSNMECPLAKSEGGAADVAGAGQYPDIRQLRLPLKAALRPQADIPAHIPPTTWQAASPATAGDFSGVAWHFATRWQAAHPGVAVGIVNTAWGGSMLETWVRRDAALADLDLRAATLALPDDNAIFQGRMLTKVMASVAQWQPGLALPAPDVARWSQADFDDSAWPTLRVPDLWEDQGLSDLDGKVWLRRRFSLTAAQAAGANAALRLAKVDDCDETHVNGQRVGGLCGYDTPRVYPLPAGLLHEAADVRLDTAAGSLPLAGLPLRGVLWCQGESNVGRAVAHEGLFQRFITDWRAQWGQRPLKEHRPMATVRSGAQGVLVVVDVQTGVVAQAWERERTVGNVALAVERARAQGVAVVWVQHHDADLPRDSAEWQWAPELRPAPGETLIHKSHNSSFEQTTLETELAALGATHIVLAGAATNWCIRATAYAALERGYDLTLVQDAHTTRDTPLEGGDRLQAAHLVRDLNIAMTWLSYPGRVNAIATAQQVDFNTPGGVITGK